VRPVHRHYLPHESDREGSSTRYGKCTYGDCAYPLRRVHSDSNQSYRRSNGEKRHFYRHHGVAVTARGEQLRVNHAVTSRPPGRTRVAVPNRPNTIVWKGRQYLVLPKRRGRPGGTSPVTGLYALQTTLSVIVRRALLNGRRERIGRSGTTRTRELRSVGAHDLRRARMSVCDRSHLLVYILTHILYPWLARPNGRAELTSGRLILPISVHIGIL